MPAAANTASNPAGEFRVAVADQEPEPLDVLLQAHQQWGAPGSVERGFWLLRPLRFVFCSRSRLPTCSVKSASLLA
jgi:hypothetical protein